MANITEIQVSGTSYKVKDAVLDSEMTAVVDGTYKFGDTRTPNAISTGWRLVPSSGLCTQNNSYKIDKYYANPGEKYYVSTNDCFQFQNSGSIPSSGTSNRIGETYIGGRRLIEAPVGTTYLVVSSTTSGGNVVKNVSESPKSDISMIAEETINFFKPIVGDIAGVSNVVFDNLDDGTFNVSGSTTSATVKIVSQFITLPAGTYKYGCIPSISTVSLQLRDYTDGTDGGSIADNTQSSANFTISSEKVVVVRCYVGANANIANPIHICPMITLSSKWPDVFIPGKSATDYVARQDKKVLRNITSQPTNFDLDNCVTGYYTLTSTQVYANAPYDVGKIAHVINLGDFSNANTTDATRYLIQFYYVDAPNATEVWMRRRAGSAHTWSNWTRIDSGGDKALKAGTSQPADYDLNNLKPGFQFLTSTKAYTNAPYDVGKVSHVITWGDYFTASQTDANRYLVQYYYTDDASNAEIWMRRRSAGTWTAWARIYSRNYGMEDNRVASFTRSAQSSQGANVGEKLRVMSYNICHFNHDISTTYISDYRLNELRKMFGKQNADILLLQEDDQYIDINDSQTSAEYVYNPMYPYAYGTNGTVLRSKFESSSSYGIVSYSNGRTLRYNIFNLSNNIKLLCCTTHMVWGGDTQEYIDQRDAQYHEMCQWVNGEITLNDYSTTNPRSVPTHTHVIIGLDSNAGTATDLVNLKSRVAAAGLIMGNCGRFGDMYTCNVNIPDRRTCIDNIIVSSNVIINNFESLCSYDYILWSDHVPVIADLTLQPVTT